MTTKEKILLENKAWVLEKLGMDKEYFERLAAIYSPSILWIQSSDIVLPVQELINTQPGEVIVYSNIANQIREDDISLMAVLEDALGRAQVEYIVVCGFSHCEGVRDILLGVDDRPAVKRWLTELRSIYEGNRDELLSLDFNDREKRLSHLNIESQVTRLSKMPIIEHAWEKSRHPFLYGWYFDLDTGYLTEVCSMERSPKLRPHQSLI
jgi:carbonic anhydrase